MTIVKNKLRANRKKMTPKKMIKCILLGCFLTCVVLALAFFPVKKVLLKSATWLQEQGFLGYLAYIGAFWLEVLLGIPSTVFEAFSGFIFGFWKALIITTIGKTGGCMLAFTVGRTLGADTLGVYMHQKFPTFKAMSIVLSQSGYKLLFMFQMAYLPIVVKCFGLSIMEVSASKFFVSVLVCGIPYTIFWSYLGSESRDMLKVLSGEKKSELTPGKIIFLVVGLSSALAAMYLLAQYSKAQLKNVEKSISENSITETSDCESISDKILPATDDVILQE